MRVEINFKVDGKGKSSWPETWALVLEEINFYIWLISWLIIFVCFVTLQDYNNHRQELFSKIVNLMEELFKNIFSKVHQMEWTLSLHGLSLDSFLFPFVVLELTFANYKSDV